MRVVAALGGNALLERGETPDPDRQQARAVTAVQALAPLAAEHELVITHGNGPQVGLLALASAPGSATSRAYPFDVLGAQTQGMIGYWLVQALQNALPGRQVACLVSRTLVREDDPAFADPSKFVGPVYDEQLARALAASRGWQVRPDGLAWRRVVPSPEQAELLDLDSIRALLDRGTIVVCCGGGGVPVARHDGAGSLRGVEGVVDKDLTASLLARRARRRRTAAAHRRARRAGRVRHGAGPADPPDYPRAAARAVLPGRIDGSQDRGRMPFRGGHREGGRYRTTRRRRLAAAGQRRDHHRALTAPARGGPGSTAGLRQAVSPSSWSGRSRRWPGPCVSHSPIVTTIAVM